MNSSLANAAYSAVASGNVASDAFNALINNPPIEEGGDLGTEGVASGNVTLIINPALINPSLGNAGNLFLASSNSTSDALSNPSIEEADLGIAGEQEQEEEGENINNDADVEIVLVNNQQDAAWRLRGAIKWVTVLASIVGTASPVFTMMNE